MEHSRDVEAGDTQAKLWNGVAGRAWVVSQALLDQVFKPFEDMLAEAVTSAGGRRVLDVGCGTGSTTLAAARALGATSQCVGVDISEPMIDAARARAERENIAATFVIANAQNYSFEPASFDTVISRFGVMFFDDSVGAFANLRGALRDGGQLRFIAWRGPAENSFMTTAERTAAPLLPNLPARRPDGPGQFAFAEEHKVRKILQDSGWADIDIRPIDTLCTFPESELVHYFTRHGPVGLILQDADGATRARVTESLRAAFSPYVHGVEVRFTAACWMVAARRAV